MASPTWEERSRNHTPEKGGFSVFVEATVSRIVIVGVGSNLGAREASIRAARDLLDAHEGVAVGAISPLYETDPVGPPQPRYLNAAFRLQTAMSPPSLLRLLWQTERRLGRDRASSARWGPRSIDLDLLWDERGVYDSHELRIPHPELQARAFALRPLLDVVPELGDRYEPTLGSLEVHLTPWARRAVVRTSASATRFEVDVEADSLVDACALSVKLPRLSGRPWATRHASVEPSPESFAELLRVVLDTGFLIHRASISRCSDAQWVVQLHGTNPGRYGQGNVRLWTTSGSERRTRACFSVSAPR
ncbi:MAG: 2-amino-4-hydroxy-6-hydroxymethyldihydropteridine diphosphokinase [Myxococcales bacterium]